MQGTEQPETRHRQHDLVRGARLGTKPSVASGGHQLPALLSTGKRSHVLGKSVGTGRE